MSNWWLLFALLFVRINVLIKVVAGIKLEEYREHVTLVSDVQEYFKVSSVFIAHPGNDENYNFLFGSIKIKAQSIIKSLSVELDMETTTLMLQLIRQFSGKQVLSLTLNYTSVPDRPHHGLIIRPLYVVLLDTAEHLEQFRLITRRCDMSYPFWLLIFTKPRPEVCGPRAKIVGNYFHLRFDTQMMVKCYGNATLMEWYAVHEDRTSVEELATWDVHTGLTLKSNASVFERRRNLQGKLMRIATMKESAFSEDGHSDAGLFTVIFSELSARLNFTVKKAYEEDLYGMYNKSTGKWSGVIGRLHANDVDFGVGRFSLTGERMDVVDFTQPIIVSRNRLYMKEPDGSYFQWSAYFRVYGMDVWMVMHLLYLITALMITLIRIKVNEKPLPPDHISENYLSVWGIYCQQGMPNFPDASPMRIAYFSILASSIILMAIYSACLISYLTLNNPTLPFSDLEGFVSDGSYKLLTFKESSDYSFFATSTNAVLKKMMKMMSDPETLPRTTLNGFKQTCNGKVAFFATEAIKSQITARIPCDLVSVKTGRIDSLGMTLTKNSPYTKLVNYHLQKFRDMGIMTRLRSKVYEMVNPVENKYIPVSFKGVMTIIVILCSGALLSLIILTVEIVIHRHQVAKQNRKLSQSTKIPEFRAYR